MSGEVKKEIMNAKDYPLVSAVIATHNRKDLVEKAIDSVRSQTYPNMELIVVDDASDDGTKERLEEPRRKGLGGLLGRA